MNVNEHSLSKLSFNGLFLSLSLRIIITIPLSWWLCSHRRRIAWSIAIDLKIIIRIRPCFVLLRLLWFLLLLLLQKSLLLLLLCFYCCFGCIFKRLNNLLERLLDRIKMNFIADQEAEFLLLFREFCEILQGLLVSEFFMKSSAELVEDIIWKELDVNSRELKSQFDADRRVMFRI